jgi:hypothetical protein
VVQNKGINIFVGLLAHPAIEMAVSGAKEKKKRW